MQSIEVDLIECVAGEVVAYDNKVWLVAADNIDLNTDKHMEKDADAVAYVLQRLYNDRFMFMTLTFNLSDSYKTKVLLMGDYNDYIKELKENEG